MCIERLRFCETMGLCIGQPYIWGGNKPLQGGADCSGLILHCLRLGGFPDIEDMTAQGIAERFHRCKTIVIKPGVLYFYGKSDDKIDHVMSVYREWDKSQGFWVLAGYIHGDSTCVDNRSAYTRKAMVSVVTSDYWKSRFRFMRDPFMEFSENVQHVQV